MEKITHPDGLAKAIAMYPTLKAFATALGVKYQVVQQWLINGVPAEYCPQIERLTGRAVRCESLNNRVDWAYVREQAEPVAPVPPAAGQSLEDLPLSHRDRLGCSMNQPSLYERTR